MVGDAHWEVCWKCQKSHWFAGPASSKGLGILSKQNLVKTCVSKSGAVAMMCFAKYISIYKLVLLSLWFPCDSMRSIVTRPEAPTLQEAVDTAPPKLTLALKQRCRVFWTCIFWFGCCEILTFGGCCLPYIYIFFVHLCTTNSSENCKGLDRIGLVKLVM